MLNVWYNYDIILLQKGLNILKQESIRKKIENLFTQDLFYYIVYIFFIWLHQAGFMMAIVA